MIRTLAAFALAATVVAAALPASAQPKPPANWPASIKIGTAQPGGAYVVYGGGLAVLLSEKLGITVSPQQTDGPNHNMILVNGKQAELGMITMGVGWEGWTGEGSWTQGRKMQDVRAIFPMYETPFHIIALQSKGVKSVAELDGKAVGVGPRGGTPGTFFPRFFEDLGVKATIRNGSGSAMSQQLQDGQLDAFAFASGIPIPAFTETEVTTPSVIFTFSLEQMKTLREKHKFLAPFTIPAATYKSLSAPLDTISVSNFGIAHKDLPADMVYEILKTFFDNHERMMQAHSAAKDSVPENIKSNTFLPFHAGAVKYYREKGLTIPQELVPPEFKG